jgi:protein-disulfide isomerase
VSNDRDSGSLFVPPSLQDHKQGVLNATIVLVMYGDYQSPQSSDVYWLIKAIQQQLIVSFGENYLCIIFRHFPQRQIHAQAQNAAEAAEAAAAQGQFWQMHELLFIHQQELGNGYLVEYANRLKLDISRFLQDMSKHVYFHHVNQDIESGLQSGVTFAPALFVNGIRYADRWNMEQVIVTITNAANESN